MNFHLLFIPFIENPYDEGYLAKTSPTNDSSFVATDPESVEFSDTKKNRMQWTEAHIETLFRLYDEYRIIYPYRNKGMTDIGWNRLFLEIKEVFPRDPITLSGCRAAYSRQLQKKEEAVSNIAQNLLQTKKHISIESNPPKQGNTSSTDIKILSQDHSTKKYQPAKKRKNFYIDFDEAICHPPTQSTSSPQDSVNSPSEYTHGINKKENLPASTQYPRPSFLMARLKNFGHLENTPQIDHTSQTSTKDQEI